MKRLRLGIIGCGIAARDLHWPPLQELNDKFEITVACNHNIGKARSYASMTGGVDVTDDYREVLTRDDVDAVIITLPYHLNREVAVASIEAGKHVLVEKPIASSLDDARVMVAADESHPEITCLLAENFRYRELFRRAAEIIENGTIGRPYQALWNYCFFVDPSENKYAQTAWRMEERYYGGFIIDAGVHNIALIRMMFGEITGGHSQITGVTPELGKYDTLSFSFSTTSGCDGVLNLFYSSMGYRENTFRIFGDNGTLLITRDKLELHREQHDVTSEDIEDGMGYRAQLEDFHRAIVSNTPVVATFREGYMDYATIAEAVMSGMENRPYRPVAF